LNKAAAKLYEIIRPVWQSVAVHPAAQPDWHCPVVLSQMSAASAQWHWYWHCGPKYPSAHSVDTANARSQQWKQHTAGSK